MDHPAEHQPHNHHHEHNEDPIQKSAGSESDHDHAGHHHGGLHHHDHAQGNIKAAFFLNLSFTIIELIGGILTNSMAILSDALHDLGDSFSLGIAWYLEKYAKKKPDAKFSFGYARFSLLGALINSFILVGGGILILSRSIPRIFDPQPVEPRGMFALAILGILVNGAAVLRLKRGTSLHEKVVSWHLLEDVLGWVVVLITSLVLLVADLPVLDPILSVVLTLYVLYNVVKNVRSIMTVLLQGVPGEVAIADLEAIMTAIPGVLSVHHTHVWSLEGERHYLSTHVVMPDDLGAAGQIALKREIRHQLEHSGIDHGRWKSHRTLQPVSRL